jgi:GNAT superfamily N-acetyltransferase
MTVNYRPAIEADVPAAAELFIESVTDMYARTGIKSPPPPYGMILTAFGHVFRTGIFYVAESDGALAAICHAIVRGPIWFLSGFWARPGWQGKGVGGRLLKIVTEEGRRAGAQTFFTWSSVDLQAMAAYMKMGMLPGYQILTFAGQPSVTVTEKAAALEPSPLALSTAMRIDEEVRGTSREVDHRFWQTEGGAQGRQLELEGEAVGYFYFNKGTIGPAAWTRQEYAEALLTTAMLTAARDATDVRLMIPGINHTAIRVSLAAGLRFAAYSHLLTTAEFGRMEQYLSSGPSLF